MSFNISDNGRSLFEELNSLDERVSAVEQNISTNDAPLTLGELYCIRKAEEMINASAYLTSSLAVPNHSYSSGDTIAGLPYSSTRKWNTFVPNHVSFETYYSALSDPNSYAYTVDPGHGAFGKLYYGIVCGVFVCHCLGIKVLRHTNWDMFGIPGMEKVDVQDAQSMRIGYIINTAKNGHTHAKVCIGVTRSRGVVTHVTLAESTDPVCKKETITASAFNELLADYTILKYNKLADNTYEPLLSAYKQSYISKNLMPKKGNKSNWSTTESVIIDVLDKGSYTNYVVYKDGVRYMAYTIGNAPTINLGVLPYGKYSMFFADGSNHQSSPVEWMVVDMQMSVEAVSGGIIRFTYSSANATPIACCWARPNDYMINLVFDVNKAEMHLGTKDTSLSTEHYTCYGVSGYENEGTQYDKYHDYYTTGNNKIRPRMFFETEFGIITTDWGASIDITYIS